MSDSPKAKAPRPATIRDVAKLAQVAIGTVSRVMNGDPSVHPAIRDATLAAARKLSYTPSPIAQSLRRGRTNTIGMVISDLNTPSFFSFVPIIQELARASGYSLLVADSQLDLDIEAKNIRSMYDSRVDGLLWMPVSPMRDELITPFRAPVVTFSATNGQVPSVGLELAEPIAQAVRDLETLGHQRIALIALRGYASSMEHLPANLVGGSANGAGLVSDGSWTFKDRNTCLAGLPAKLLERRPTALLAPSALLGPTLTSLRELQIAIPGEMSVVCIGDCELAEAYDPPITTIGIDPELRARTAIALLLRLMNGQDPECEQVIIECSIIPGASVAPPPGTEMIAAPHHGEALTPGTVES